LMDDGRHLAWLGAGKDTLLQSADLVTGGGASPANVPAACILRRAMIVRGQDWFTDALIAVGLALMAVGTYKLLVLLGLVLTGAP
jgi:hypothetical protein